MAGIAAILSFDGRPVEGAEAAALLRHGPRPPAGVLESWSRDSAALARLHYPTTGRDPLGQPHIDARSDTALVFDGRIDNHLELIAELSLASRVSDAAIVHAAVLRWDADAAGHLLGDFAFVWWDPAQRRALLARDHLGVRTLHVHAARWGLVCASEIAQVLAHARVPRRPDLLAVAESLSGDWANTARTLFDGVTRVPPGHVAIISSGSVRMQSYWRAEPRRAIRYATDGEYAEHCRALLLQSVRCRMESDGPVATTLSGGIDSSSVTVAARVVGGAGGAPRSFGLIFPGHPETDERQYIEAVAAGGAPPVLIRAAAVEGQLLDSWVSRWLDMPATAADAAAVPMWQEMAAQGFRVALTGVAGDLVFSGSPFYYADLLRSGHFAHVRAHWSGRTREIGRRAATLELLRTGAWPALPARLKQPLRPLARRGLRLLPGEDRTDCLSLPRPTNAAPVEPRGGSFATEQMIRELTSGTHSYFVDMAGRVAIEAGVELRHPLLDIRLIQFALEIPEEQRQRGPMDRYVLRRAMARELPPEVAGRLTKADFTHVVVEALTALGGVRYFSDLAIARAGWVNGRRAAALYERVLSGYRNGNEASGNYVPQLWWIAAVERWYRAAFPTPPPLQRL
jgi:asparagine synthase (glutamine-hydrolysing)